MFIASAIKTDMSVSSTYSHTDMRMLLYRCQTVHGYVQSNSQRRKVKVTLIYIPLNTTLNLPLRTKQEFISSRSEDS